MIRTCPTWAESRTFEHPELFSDLEKSSKTTLWQKENLSRPRVKKRLLFSSEEDCLFNYGTDIPPSSATMIFSVQRKVCETTFVPNISAPTRNGKIINACLCAASEAVFADETPELSVLQNDNSPEMGMHLTKPKFNIACNSPQCNVTNGITLIVKFQMKLSKCDFFFSH